MSLPPDHPFARYVATLFEALGERDPTAVLRETPAALRQATAGLSDAHLRTPEAPGKWSVIEVAQHLADSELVGGFRFRMVLAHDRPLLPGYDQDEWAARLNYRNVKLADAIADYTALRQANLRLFAARAPTDFDRVMLHSERGEEGLGYMRRMYAGHDLVHLRQIARIRRAIGAPA
ncbi:MAG TPA: DinB family protein [Gemmatimonadales bacterium]|nr:DinB family protein [Gemmatimonadales bacterium]